MLSAGFSVYPYIWRATRSRCPHSVFGPDGSRAANSHYHSPRWFTAPVLLIRGRILNPLVKLLGSLLAEFRGVDYRLKCFRFGNTLLGHTPGKHTFREDPYGYIDLLKLSMKPGPVVVSPALRYTRKCCDSPKYRLLYSARTTQPSVTRRKRSRERANPSHGTSKDVLLYPVIIGIKRGFISL